MRRVLLRLVALFRSNRAEADLTREIDAHLRLLEDQFVARGMRADEARAAARRAFGGVEQAKERQRDARSFRWLDNSWLDAKLGARMLVKYPGLTVVGGLGMAVAIAIAAGAFSILYALVSPALPLHEGDRVVAIENWDTAAARPERRILHDFAAWRDELRSIQDVGAYRQVTRTLIAPGVQADTVLVVEMSAAGFRIARVPPLVGRFLLDADESAGAPPALVIGHDEWRNRFASNSGVVGRTVQLGDVQHSIVGVMPEGFAFPVNNDFWIALRADPSRYERRRGPAISVFGRLAPGATFESAQAELTTIGQRAAAELPKTHERLRPQLAPYTYPFFDLHEAADARPVHVVQFLITLLLVVVCVNVAILVYARTATRQGEIALRTALGAGRRRIVSQLFVEALVLAALAAVVGLAITATGLRFVRASMANMSNQIPFWWDFRLTAEGVIYVVALTLLAAAIVGILPALKATRRATPVGLQGLAGGGAQMRMGKTWTVLIVAQVGFAVALLPAVVYQAWDAVRIGTADPGFPAQQYLTAELGLDRGSAPAIASGPAEQEFRARAIDRQSEVVRRLEAEASLSAVTFASSVPGEGSTVWIEADGVPTPGDSHPSGGGYALGSGTRAGHQVGSSRVDPRLFDVLEVPVLTGRPFENADTNPASSAVIVNRSFVRGILGGGNALGRRVRYVGVARDATPANAALGRWYEIVGVVEDFPAQAMKTGVEQAKLYHAAAVRDVYPLILTMRVRAGTPSGFTGRLREVAAAVDPNLQVWAALSLDERLRKEQGMLHVIAAVLAILTVSVTVLVSAGIYALMSFTVSQRRREIGIRAALGADPRQIVGSIFSRALVQLAIGAAIGAGASALLEYFSRGELMRGNGPVLLPVIALFMMLVGLAAAVGPARRGLRINPTEALRAE